MKVHVLKFPFIITALIIAFFAGPQSKAQLRGSALTRGKGLFGSIGSTKPTKSNPSAVQDLFSTSGKMLDEKPIPNIGRNGKSARMRAIMNDDKTPKSQRGWLKQEFNAVKQGKRKNPRNPIGYDLAHPRGLEASKGYDHSRSKLQSRDLHRTQHKFDNGGRKQITQPKALEGIN